MATKTRKPQTRQNGNGSDAAVPEVRVNPDKMTLDDLVILGRAGKKQLKPTEMRNFMDKIVEGGVRGKPLTLMSQIVTALGAAVSQAVSDVDQAPPEDVDLRVDVGLLTFDDLDVLERASSRDLPPDEMVAFLKRIIVSETYPDAGQVPFKYLGYLTKQLGEAISEAVNPNDPEGN